MSRTIGSLLLVVALLIAGQLGWFVGETLDNALFRLSGAVSLLLIPIFLVVQFITLLVDRPSPTRVIIVQDLTRPEAQAQPGQAPGPVQVQGPMHPAMPQNQQNQPR